MGVHEWTTSQTRVLVTVVVLRRLPTPGEVQRVGSEKEERERRRGWKIDPRKMDPVIHSVSVNLYMTHWTL